VREADLHRPVIVAWQVSKRLIAALFEEIRRQQRQRPRTWLIERTFFSV
jgi:hypothetical protein